MGNSEGRAGIQRVMRDQIENGAEILALVSVSQNFPVILKLTTKITYTGYLSTWLVDILLEGLARAIRQEKWIKGIQIGKAIKQPLFTDGMIAYMENPTESIRKLSELTATFSNVLENKMNTRKSVVQWLKVN